MENKFRSRALLGGWDAWVKAGGETEPVKPAGGCGHKPGGCGKPGCGAKPPSGGCGKPPAKQKPQRL